MADQTQSEVLVPAAPIPLTVVETGKIADLEAQVAALKAELNKPGPLAVAGSWAAKWHPVFVGAAVAVLPALLNYFGAVDWQTLGVSPTAGVMIGAIIVALRTTTLRASK